jgi:raffinose/stachyose/melibiose transport system substrate-binding protein
VKKTKWVVLILVLSLVVTACSNKSSNDSGEGEKVELVYMTHSPDNELQKKVIEEDIIGAFEKEHPSIEIKWVQNQDPVALTRQQLAAGAGPDIVLVDGPTQVVQFAKSGYLLPLDDFATEYGWNDRYYEWAYDTGFVDGKLYGLPGQYESLVVWYNKDLFAEKGWEEPANFSEFMQLNGDIANEGLIPFAFGTTDFRPANEWWLSVVYNSYLGPDEFKKVLENDVPWTSDLVNEATEIWVDIWQKGYINEKKSHAISGDDAWNLFRNEKAAMKMEGTWATSTFTTNPTDFEVDFFVMPGWREGVEPTLPMALGESVGINSKTKHPDEAAAFIDWLFSDEVGSMMFEQGYFYPNKGIEAPSDIDPIVKATHEALNEGMDKGNTGYASWTYWGPNVQHYLWDNIDSVFLDQLSVEDYLKKAQENADKDEEEGLLFNFKN